MIKGFFEESIIKRAIDKQLVEIEIVNLREFALDDYGMVDDRPYGGGAGMVLRVEPIHKALQIVKDAIGQSKDGLQHDKRVIITSPKGDLYNQKKAQEFSKLEHLVIIAGHYEAVDERVMEYVDEEVSMGDFVLTGGEIVASAVVDSIVRLIPGVLKKDEATQIESFFTVSIDTLINVVGSNDQLRALKEKGTTEVQLLEYPHYTRPEEFEGKKVPDVLLSGNHKQIEEWRIKKAFEETLKKRPDLLK